LRQHKVREAGVVKLLPGDEKFFELFNELSRYLTAGRNF